MTPCCRTLAIVVGAVLALSGCQKNTEAPRPAETPSAASSTTAPAPPAARFTEKTIDHTMVSRDDLGPLIGVQGLEPIRGWASLNDTSDAVDNKDCLSVVAIGEKTVYEGSGYTASRAVIDETTGDDFQHVEQSAVIFPSADAATAFVDKAKQIWERCAGVPVTVTYPGDEPFTTVAEKPVVQPNSVITVTSTMTDNPGWTCPEAMGVEDNLVVEAMVCRMAATDQPSRIVEQMLKNAAK